MNREDRTRIVQDCCTAAVAAVLLTVAFCLVALTARVVWYGFH